MPCMLKGFQSKAGTLHRRNTFSAIPHHSRDLVQARSQGLECMSSVVKSRVTDATEDPQCRGDSPQQTADY
ncbi:hypothetical protein TNCV_4476031 [Trichonephila clavipes]|nr:hypothetical protein TNCV_4476031 [Trichonephila clavipes]